MDFQLIETMLCENGEIFLLEGHMKRLKKSSKHFAFESSAGSILQEIWSITQDLDPEKKYRLRLLLSRDATFTISTDILEKTWQEPVSVGLSESQTNKSDIFLQHKTTRRELYNKAFKKAREKGLYDLLFVNTGRELTEGAISNVYILKNNKYYTPPLTSGVLPGVYRDYLLAKEDFPLEEKVLRLEDLHSADKIYLSNSVHKMLEAKLA